MKRFRILAAAVLALCAIAGDAASQVAYTDSDPNTGARLTVPVTPKKPLPAQDGYNGPFTGVTNMPTDATVYTAGRSFEAECTIAGAVKVTFSDATQRTINLSVGDNIRPYAVTAWSVAGVSGPATCTYANLK